MDYEMAVRMGGKIRTVRLDANRYRHFCYFNGVCYPGEVRFYKRPEGHK